MLNKLKFLKYFISALLTTYLFALSQMVYAADATLGQAAQNILEPVEFATEGFYKICYIIGGTFIFASGIQYKNYRNNPSAVRISTPIVLFLLGVALILLPIISMVSPASQATAVQDS